MNRPKPLYLPPRGREASSPAHESRGRDSEGGSPEVGRRRQRKGNHHLSNATPVPTSTVGRPHERIPSAVTRGSLRDGLLISLGLLRRDPDHFDPVAVAWHARLCSSVPGLSIADAREALDALQALAGPDPEAGVRRLGEICSRCELEDVAAVLDRWMERRRT